MQDEDGYMLEDDVEGADNDTAEHKPSDGVVASKGKLFVLQGFPLELFEVCGFGGSSSVLAYSILARPRHVFPTIRKTDNPLATLPTFLSVLGKKIENGCIEQDIVCLFRPYTPNSMPSGIPRLTLVLALGEAEDDEQPTCIGAAGLDSRLGDSSMVSMQKPHS